MKPRRSRDRAKERGATPVAADAAPSTRIDAAWSPRTQMGAAALLLALVLSLLFHEIAWQGKIFAAPDFQSPSDFATAGRRALDAGEYPLWNPYIFLGMPSFGSLAFTPYVFPLTPVLSAIGALPGVPPLAWLLCYFWLGGFGAFVLTRSLVERFWPSVLAAVGFMITPHLVSWGVFGHGSKLASGAMLPWLLWAALRMRNAARPWLWTAVLAFILGLQLLRAHPQIAFYGLLMLAVWTIVDLVASIRDRVARRASLWFAARMAVAVVLGVGLAAVLLFPVRAYAPDSIRGAAAGGGVDYEYATAWSQSLREVTTFVVPSSMGFGEATYVGSMPFTNFPHYLGQAAVLFGIAGLVLLRGRWMVFLATLLVVSLLVSFGRHAPLLYNLFYEALPYFNRFRVPVMILVLFQLGSAVLAGLGCAALFGVKPRFVEWRWQTTARTPRRVLIAAAGAALVLTLAALPWADALASQVSALPRLPAAARDVYAGIARDLLRGDGLRLPALLVANALVVFLVWKRRLNTDVAGGLLVLLLCLDLGNVDRRMVHPQKTWPGVPERLTQPMPRDQSTPMLDFLRAQRGAGGEPVRVLPTSRAFFESNQWMSHDIASVGGYHPAKLERFQRVYEGNVLSNSRVHDMLGVQYFVHPEPLSGMDAAAYSGAEGVAYANPTAFPRAWVVGEARQVDGEACVATLLDADFQPRRQALVESAPPGGLSGDWTGGEATIQSFSANRVELQVDSPAPGLLVLSEAYHRNWRARVNGERRDVLAANCVLRAVAVPGGTSQVVFEFVDPALRAGLGVSLGSLAAVVLLFLLGMRRRLPVAHRSAAIPEGSA